MLYNYMLTYIHIPLRYINEDDHLYINIIDKMKYKMIYLSEIWTSSSQCYDFICV